MPNLSFSTRGANAYYMAAVAICCTFFYLVGIWQHTASVTTDLSPLPIVPEIPCNLFRSNPSPDATTTRSRSASLDFYPKHTADHLLPPAAEENSARVPYFPACDAKMSEYTPCEDTQRSLRFRRDRLIYRERHCPEDGEKLRCRIPAPHGYRLPFRWPESREMAWFANVPHKELAVEKKKQNWVRFNRDRFHFPGGGTMFPNGAAAYIDDIGKLINLRDGSIRTALDTGCGVASWGAYLLSRDILAMSFAPRDTHEAQVQFALERGVPAMIGVLASNRLPYPSRAFDMAHCSRCLIPWGLYDGLFLMEIDRVLRPGGYWILSGPPINWQQHWRGWERTREDLNAEQSGIETIARSLCWKKLKQKEDIAIWQKPTNHIHCKINRKVFKFPQFCPAQDQDPDKAWYTKMETCMTLLPDASNVKEVAGGQLAKWPERLTAVPPRINSRSLEGITADNFKGDTELWRRRVAHYKTLDRQLAERGRYRNLLDMNAHLGGFAAALAADPVWVMNVVTNHAQPNTLGIIYERGLIGTYQDWYRPLSSYLPHP
ncbi:hypothetical protein SAY86_003632 [Trapa natans]|uniref:Methyltransferase n=1 Tax=Trapa natans TaxID=22666 RepID=A0AAN7MX09_TRANT|nr:hypothetical protein SAY86_003632 [Trapa natans]